MSTDAAGAALQGLLSRQSVGIKHLREPGPSDEQLQRMVEAALRAPDHAGLVPFRFALVRGDARERLGDLFVQAAIDGGKSQADAMIDRERAQRAPVTVAVVARIDSGHPLVPAHEQWACVGGALTNLLNAAHAMGFGGKMLSGSKVRHPALQQAFCEPGETLLGWIALGTPADSPSRKVNKPRAADVVREWQR
ncbi:MAG: nitroreductase [Burkholderiaceae bacterium]|nr:nitroreductase [Burkholderiaceae bacterium]